MSYITICLNFLLLRVSLHRRLFQCVAIDGAEGVYTFNCNFLHKYNNKIRRYFRSDMLWCTQSLP